MKYDHFKYQISILLLTGLFIFGSQATLKTKDDVHISTSKDINNNNSNTLKNHETYDSVLWKKSPVDLSFLNKDEIPAGKHGFLKTVGEKLIFEDGTVARFWGTNIQSSALFFTNKANTKLHAKRLSKLGFNLVRIHHHDAGWIPSNIFGQDSKSTLTIDNNMLNKIDWWIKCLKDEGIYVWLDLNVGRRFTSHDAIKNYNEIAKAKGYGEAKGFLYFNRDIEQRLIEFNTAYLNHINPFTKVAYKNEPAIIAVLLTNENDITHHYGNKLLPDKGVPIHNKQYMELANKFANKHDLPQNMIWKAWLPGPSKLFLNNQEHLTNIRMVNHLRHLGIKIPIATTNTWGYAPLSSLPAIATSSDIIDVHSYGRSGELKINPVKQENFLNWIAAAQVVNKPLSVSEWNVARFPVIDRHNIPIYIASIASLQGWDALMQFGYANRTLNKNNHPNNWQFYNDPALLSVMPAAALLFRNNHVKEAKTTYVFKPGSHEFYYSSLSPKSSSTIRTLTERSKLFIDIPKTKELPWIETPELPDNAIILSESNLNFSNTEKHSIESDTGELYRNWNDGIFTVNTEHSQVISGNVGNRKINLNDVNFEISTANAVIAVQSLTTMPIRNSNEILISFSSISEPNKINNKYRLPFTNKPVEGTIIITAPDDLILFKLQPDGKKTPIDFKVINNQYTVTLPNKPDSHWFILSQR